MLKFNSHHSCTWPLKEYSIHVGGIQDSVGLGFEDLVSCCRAFTVLT